MWWIKSILTGYLVMKRVSIEPNFHTLYINFLDALNEEQIFVAVGHLTLASVALLYGAFDKFLKHLLHVKSPPKSLHRMWGLCGDLTS